MSAQPESFAADAAPRLTAQDRSLAEITIDTYHSHSKSQRALLFEMSKKAKHQPAPAAYFDAMCAHAEGHLRAKLGEVHLRRVIPGWYSLKYQLRKALQSHVDPFLFNTGAAFVRESRAGVPQPAKTPTRAVSAHAEITPAPVIPNKLRVPAAAPPANTQAFAQLVDSSGGFSLAAMQAFVESHPAAELANGLSFQEKARVATISRSLMLWMKDLHVACMAATWAGEQ